MSEVPSLIKKEGYGSFENNTALLVLNRIGSYLLTHPNYNQLYCGDTEDIAIVQRFVDDFGVIHEDSIPKVGPNCVRGNTLNVFFIKCWTLDPFQLGTTSRLTFTPTCTTDVLLQAQLAKVIEMFEPARGLQIEQLQGS